MHLKEIVAIGVANRLPRTPLGNRWRVRLLRIAGMTIGSSCSILGPLTITPTGFAGRITIGNNCFINTETRFGLAGGTVSIGNDVQIGPRVMFETVNHELRYTPGRLRKVLPVSKPITVEDGVWIGAGVIITQAITIGSGSVVAAGAVVAKDVPTMTIVGGIPAKKIRAIDS